MISKISMLRTNTKKLIYYILVIIFGIGIIRYQIHLLSYLEWEDEITHIVTSKLIYSGKKLYSEIHELHGPLTFLSGLMVESLGGFSVRAHRVPIAILQWLAWIALFFSPLLKGQTFLVRFTYVLVCATISLIYLPDIFGHTYLFQVISGLLLIIILSQYTLPTIFNPNSQNRNSAIFGNALIACLPFLAFTYIPICGALFFASLTRQNFRISIYSLVASAILNLLFLSAIGSIPGYIAMHFWINLAVSRQFIEGEALGLAYLIKSALNALTIDLSRFAVFLLIASGIARLSQFNRNNLWRSILLGIGIASLLTRSQGFQGLTLLYLSFSIPLIFLYTPNTKTSSFQYRDLFFIPIWIVCLIKILLLSPANIADRQIRITSPFSSLVQKITNQNDVIISWPFQNYEYLLSNRLPASGNYFYLPWQSEYYKNPKLGISIDTCKELTSTKPKIMLISEYSFNGIKWKQYEPACLEPFLNNYYHRLPNTAYYIRNDIYEENKNKLLNR